MAHDTLTRLLLALALGGNLISYASWGFAIFRSDEVPYVKNHAVREIVYGVGLTAVSAWLLLRPLTPSTAWLSLVLSGFSVLGFWVGLALLGGLAGIGRVFAGRSASYALALHVPQLILWLAAAAWVLFGGHAAKQSGDARPVDRGACVQAADSI